MRMPNGNEKQMRSTLDALNAISFSALRCEDAGRLVPSRIDVIQMTDQLVFLMFPECYSRIRSSRNQEDTLKDIAEKLETQTMAAFGTAGEEGCAKDVCGRFIDRLPDIKKLLVLDVQALYEGDPAAVSPDEVLLCYPGLFAISVYRFAHELFLLGVPILPRMMTEYAHEKTGIDIHPGAVIGRSFFIDHGTGIVIGETTVIGDRVKLYQGVTLGAKSFRSDENGNPVKKIKRHPNIGNDVTIYANATILGGDTTIGDGCVIGGNTWLTHSLESGRMISRDYCGEKGEN